MPGFGDMRDASETERVFFQKNPHVAGMADFENDMVVLNPFSSLSSEELDAVAKNERARLLLRRLGGSPVDQMTGPQEDALARYSTNRQDIRDTLMARILSGDPSVGQPTPAQGTFASALGPILDAATRGAR